VAALTVWKFDSDRGAELAVDTLLDVRATNPSVVLDAAVVSWAHDNERPLTADVVRPEGDGLGATFWGLLFGVIFFVPLLGAAVGSPPGTMTGWLVDAGITDHFVNRVRDEVVPGTSALFVVASSDDMAKLQDAFFERDQPELLALDLSNTQERALHQVFGKTESR